MPNNVTIVLSEEMTNEDAQPKSVRVSGKLTAEQFLELRRILWAPHYRMNRFNNYCWHRIGFIRIMSIVFVIATAIGVLFHNPSDVKTASCIAFSIGGVALVLLASRSDHLPPKLLARLNRDMPASIDLNESGIHINGDDDTSLSIPWHRFKGWRAADTIAVLDRAQSAPWVPLSLSSPDPADRTRIEDLLLRKLGTPDPWADKNH